MSFCSKQPRFCRKLYQE